MIDTPGRSVANFLSERIEGGNTLKLGYGKQASVYVPPDYNPCAEIKRLRLTKGNIEPQVLTGYSSAIFASLKS
jgi:hypothetical protein